MIPTRSAERERRGLPRTAQRHPRPERAHHLGRHSQPDGRQRRVLRRPVVGQIECTLIGALACIESPPGTFHRRRDRVRRHLLLQRHRGWHRRQSGAGDGAAARGRDHRLGAVPQLRADPRHHATRACSCRAVQPPHWCSSTRASTPPKSYRPSQCGTVRRISTTSSRVSQSSMWARRTGPTPTWTATWPTSPVRRCRCARTWRTGTRRGPAAVLRARRHLGRQQLDPGPGPGAGPGDSLRDPAL